MRIRISLMKFLPFLCICRCKFFLSFFSWLLDCDYIRIVIGVIVYLAVAFLIGIHNFDFLLVSKMWLSQEVTASLLSGNRLLSRQEVDPHIFADWWAPMIQMLKLETLKSQDCREFDNRLGLMTFSNSACISKVSRI